MKPTSKHPVKVHLGPGSVDRLPEALGARRAILLTTPGMEKRGVVSRLAKGLGDRLVRVCPAVKTYPTIDFINQLSADLSILKFDVFIALGGGSVMDSTKALALCFSAPKREEYLLNHLKGVSQPELPTKPIIAIPTTAGTGSEATPWGTLWDLKENKKYSVSHPSLYPEIALCDPDMTKDLPYDLSLFTGLDALSHAMESIWNQNATDESDAYATKALTLLFGALSNNYAASYSQLATRAAMQEGSLLAGKAISFTKTALAHSISYPLTAHFQVPHGLACSFTLGDVMAFNEKANPDRIRLLLQAMGASSVEVAGKEFKKMYEETGAKTRLEGFLGEKEKARLSELNYITPARSGNNLAKATQEDAVAIVESSLNTGEAV